MKTISNLPALIIVTFLLPLFSIAQTSNDIKITGIEKTKDSEYVAAIREYDKAIQLDSNNAGTYYNRGLSKSKLQDYKGAIADFARSNKLQPTADAYFNSGYARYKISDIKGAMSDFDKTIELNPSQNAEVYFYRGNINFMNSDYFSAIKEFTKAIEINPSYAKAFFNKALSEKNLNQRDESCKDFARAKELGYAESQAAIAQYCNTP